jgi:hypothetical protein
MDPAVPCSLRCSFHTEAILASMIHQTMGGDGFQSKSLDERKAIVQIVQGIHLTFTIYILARRDCVDGPNTWNDFGETHQHSL